MTISKSNIQKYQLLISRVTDGNSWWVKCSNFKISFNPMAQKIFWPPDPLIRIPNKTVRPSVSILILFSTFVIPFPENSMQYSHGKRKKREKRNGLCHKSSLAQNCPVFLQWSTYLLLHKVWSFPYSRDSTKSLEFPALYKLSGKILCFPFHYEGDWTLVW